VTHLYSCKLFTLNANSLAVVVMNRQDVNHNRINYQQRHSWWQISEWCRISDCTRKRLSADTHWTILSVNKLARPAFWAAHQMGHSIPGWSLTKMSIWLTLIIDRSALLTLLCGGNKSIKKSSLTQSMNHSIAPQWPLLTAERHRSGGEW